jgi:catechol 2,3-dioxygenase-like lactoylglutathione lyase family enzyme
MKIMPIRYVADVAAATRFYTALGLVQGDSARSGNWTELNGSGGMLGLHAASTASEQDTPGRVELSFETQEPLEALAERLTAAGFEPEAIVDENFGRSLLVVDPDGVLVQVNEHDRELYT